jgi:hypothetical protein
MAAKIISFFWLANAIKKSSLKQLNQMEPNLAGSIYVRSKHGNHSHNLRLNVYLEVSLAISYVKKIISVNTF